MAKFCTSCGQPLGESGICSNCNTAAKNNVSSAASNGQQTVGGSVPPPNPNEAGQGNPNYQANWNQGQQMNPGGGQPYNTGYAQPAPPNPYVLSMKEILRNFFSKDPTTIFESGLKSSLNLYLIFGGAYCLAWILTMVFMPGNLIKQILGTVAGSAMTAAVNSQINELMPMSTLFLMGLLLGGVVYVAYSLLVKAIYMIGKHPIPMKLVFNMVAVALLPSTVCMLAGFLIGFLFAYVGLMLIGVGSIMSVIMIYKGIEKEGSFAASPMWLFMAAYAVCQIIIIIVTSKIVMPAIYSKIIDLVGDFASYLW